MSYLWVCINKDQLLIKTMHAPLFGKKIVTEDQDIRVCDNHCTVCQQIRQRTNCLCYRQTLHYSITCNSIQTANYVTTQKYNTWLLQQLIIVITKVPVIRLTSSSLHLLLLPKNVSVLGTAGDGEQEHCHPSWGVEWGRVSAMYPEGVEVLLTSMVGGV